MVSDAVKWLLNDDGTQTNADEFNLEPFLVLILEIPVSQNKFDTISQTNTSSIVFGSLV